jgi:glycosyltransferase involved in cell wall biosynthesis
MQKQLLVVLGMHRSGTSAIARGLQVLGASLGDALLPAGFDNPKGFWEDRDILRINEALLAELQSAYDHVGLLDADERSPVIAALENDARTALAQKFAQVDFFALKDPRLARLLPFWQRVFAAADLSVAYVIALRNPLSVADSLARRNGFDRIKSALLWQEHLLAAVHHTQGQRRVVVDYDRLLDDPEAAFRRIAEQLGIGPVLPEALHEYQASFLDAGLRHTRYTREDVLNAPDLPQGVRDLYLLLADCTEDRRSLDDSALVPLLAQQRESLRGIGPVLKLLGRLDDRAQYQEQRLGEQERVRTELEQTLTRLGEAHAQVHGEAQRLQEVRVEQEERIAELQAQVAELSVQAAELHALRATRLWRLRDILRLEPWSLGKAARIAHLSLSLATPAPLRRRIPTALRRDLSVRVLPTALVAGDFDADLYVHLYPDVAAAGVDPHTHYQRYGRPEGRLGQLPSIPGLDTLHDLDPARETVLVVCHEGSRTGAPILGYNLVRELLPQYNVVTLFLGPGPMLEACRALGAAVLGPTAHHRHPVIADRTVAAILERAPLRFALINSVEARFPLAPLARRHIPTVSLLHEFAANTRPHGAFLETARWSGATVFSSRLTRDDAWASHGELREIAFPIIPQGRCVLPGGSAAGASAPAPSSAVRPADFPTNGLVVLGLGGVHIRKGVDLFLDCAARVCRSAPDLPIRFVWVGKGYDPENDAHYSVYLADQIQRAGLAQRVQFLDELPDLQGVYAAADVLLLSSRLDPLPNVAIDALSEGLPVLCFDEATGIADILREHGLADACVAPYLDTAGMAEQLLSIARSPTLRRDLAERAGKLAVETFRMPHYVERIVALAEAQRLRSQQEATDIATIVDAGVLQPDHALQPGISAATDAEEAAWLYVRSWASGVSPRKPFPSFHPGIYRECHGLAQPDADPLADYLRQGRPEGPWLLPLITPATPARPVHGQRIALQIHAFYPDLVAPILDALGQNRTDMDLLVSVVQEGDRQRLAPLFQNYRGGRVEVRVVPNRGRDLGPFCTAFADTIRRNYDLVGHVHTKRSPEIGAEAGRQWVRFLLTHLLGGGPVPMADRILGVMAADPCLGMVFPDDPNIVSWGENRPPAEALARRLGIDPLPEAIVFPVGSMFWARVAALEPLLGLGLSWADYPIEPLPYDGTLLHALERLLPLVVTKTGHTLALSHVPGVTR